MKNIFVKQICIIAMYKATLVKSDKILQTYFSPCKSMKSEEFPFQFFWLYLTQHQVPLLRYRIVVKYNIQRKIFVAESINITILLQNIVYSTAQVFLHSCSQMQPPEAFCKGILLQISLEVACTEVSFQRRFKLSALKLC